jgi:hypothetical protein
MVHATNDTRLMTPPAGRGATAIPTPAAADRTADLARILRHALRAGADATPLDRAIRAAAQRTAAAQASEDEDGRVRLLARQMNVLLARRADARPADPHRETVRG